MNVADYDITASRSHLGRFGPWALVTGASSGIGREFALRIAREGLNVVLVARSKENLENLAAEIRSETSAVVRVLAADLATSEGIRSVEAGTLELSIGLLIAAAGFGTSGTFADADLALEREMLDVNCWGSLALAHAFSRRFLERGNGGIVLFSSLLGWQGTPYAAHYVATKAYVQALAEGLHVELRPHGVHVLACAPGPVRSAFASRAGMVMGRAASPADLPAATLQALGRRSTIVPDNLSKFFTYSLATMPRFLRVRTMGAIMGGMTRSGRKGAAPHS